MNKLKEEVLFFRAKKIRHLLANVDQSSNTSPFFIISCGRSGTTLLRKLLMENYEVHIPPESDDNIPRLIEYYTKSASVVSWDSLVDNCLSLFQNSHCFQYWNLDLSETKYLLYSLQEPKKKLSSIIDCIYLSHKNEHNPGNKMWGDKTPYLIFKLKWLKLVYPKAKMIYLIRDGRDVVASSISMTNWSLKTASQRWVDSVKSFERNKAGWSYIQVKYEDLVKNSGKQLERVANFIGAKRKRHNEMHNLELGDTILGHHRNIFCPVNPNSINKHQRDLTEDMQLYLNSKMKKYLRLYGYI